MAITLDGTNGILSPDFEPSSSTTPTNGLFLPATNALGFATNSTERLRLDASGNLGLGVTPSAWGTAYRTAMQIGSAACFAGVSGVGASDYFAVGGNFYLDSGAGYKYIRSTTANRLEASAGEFRWYTAPSGTAGAAISFTQAMTLDASGRLGIGDTSPSVGLSVVKYGTAWNSDVAYPKPAGNVFIFMQGQSGQNNWFGLGGAYGASTGSANLLLQANYNDAGQGAGNYIASEATGVTTSVLTFGRIIGGGTVGTPATKSEAARIDSSGNLLVGTTSNPGGKVVVSHNSVNDNGLVIADTRTSGSAYQIQFLYNGSQCGYVQTTSTTTTYNSGSDQRLKENIVDAPSAIDSVNAIKVRSFDWKADGSHVDYGYIAQELLQVAPEAVSVHEDAEQMMGVDHGKLTPRLVKAIQELTARLEALEAK